MRRMFLFFAALVAVFGFTTAPSAFAQCPNNGAVGAPCVHTVGSGSSAMFQQTGIEVVNTVAPATNGFTANGGGSIHHLTLKGNCTGSALAGGHCANLHDQRGAGENESTTQWIVWVCGNVGGSSACNNANVTDLWIYNQVDSTVGDRTFLARPAALSQTTNVTIPASQTNLINSTLLLHGDTLGAATGGCVAGFLSTCDWATGTSPLPTDVQGLVNSQTTNAGFSDIRAEDGFYATLRALATGNANATGLGYGPGPFGTPIQSAFSTATATPAAFALPGGTDPISGAAVPATIQTFPIGEEEILFITNRTDAGGLGAFTGVVPTYGNVVDNGVLGTGFGISPLGALFGGGVDAAHACDGTSAAFGSHPGNVFAVNPILREALSGTMNTTEFTEFDTYGGTLAVNGSNSVGHGSSDPGTSQEINVFSGGAPINPLGGANVGTPCTNGAGKRYRAIGTGEMVGGTSGVGGVKFTADSIGYAFFSFGNVSAIGKNPSYGYLTLDGIDPIFNAYAGGDPGQPATTAGTDQGELPTCDVTKNGTVGSGCLATDVWTAGNSFPNLRNGTYRAWSILRVLCDTADPTCDAFNSAQNTGDKFGTVALVEAAQDDIHGTGPHAAQAVADFLPFSLDGSFPAGAESIYGDASFARSHYAFASVGAGLPSDTPANHRYQPYTVGPSATPAGAVPGVSVNASQPNGTFTVPISAAAGFFLAGPYAGHYFSLEQGGDAGGCIINATQSGDLGTLTAVQPINNATGTPNVNHIKFFFTNISGPNSVTEPNGAGATFGTDSPGAGGPFGWCGGGGRNGLYCNVSNTGPANANTVPTAPACGAVGFQGDPQNPFGYTCNPTHFGSPTSKPGDGESLTVSGITTANYTDFNGTFHISKFVSPGVIKTNVSNTPVLYPAGLGKASVNAGVQVSVQAGCVQ